MPRTVFQYATALMLSLALPLGYVSASSVNVAITDVNIVDPKSGTVSENQMILITDGEIVAIEDTQTVDADLLIDGRQRFAIPGLFDTHVHSLVADADRLMVDQGLFIAFGVTHVREMGAGFDTFVASLETFSSNPGRPQPARIAAGPLLDNISYQWYNQTVIASSEQAAQVLPELAEAGVDFFKVYSGLSPEAYEGILEQAEKLGMPVDGHVPNAVGLSAVAAGSQRTIEHLNYDTFMTCAALGVEWGPIVGSTRFSERGWEAYYERGEEFWADVDWDVCVDPALTKFAERGGIFVPTLLMEVMTTSRIDMNDTQLLSSSDWCRQNMSSVEAADPAIRQRFERAVRIAFDRVRNSDVTILAGTDSQNFCLTPGVSLAWEIETMAEFGMTNAEALNAATGAPAEAFGFGSQIGLIEQGFDANIVLLDENPLVSLETLRRPTGVYTQERWYDEAALLALRKAGMARQPEPSPLDPALDESTSASD